MRRNIQKLTPLFFIVFLAISTVLIVFEYARNQGFDDTDASAKSKLEFFVINEPEVPSLNSIYSLGVIAREIKDNSEVRIASLDIGFDPSTLSLSEITISENVLLVEDNVDNVNGTANIDFTNQLTGNFPTDYLFFRLDFIILNQSDPLTRVSLLSSSNFGVPNTLDTQSLPFKDIETAPSYCGDNIVQAPNFYDINEACDDGDMSDGDLCSRDCLNTCTGRFVWDGTRCVDYNIDETSTPTPTVTITQTTTPTVVPTTIRPTMTTTVTNTPTATQVTPSVSPSTTVTETATITPTEETNPKSNTNMILLYIIVIISTIAVGSALYFILKGN